MDQKSAVQRYCEQCFQVLGNRFGPINDELRGAHIRIAELAARIAQLEKHIHYPHSLGQEVAMKEAAVRAEAVPMRSDVETILTLRAFVESIATGGVYAWSVPRFVNEEADEALGRKK